MLLQEVGAWQQEQRSVEELLQQFQTFRHQTIELISTLSEDEWEKPREEAFWNKPLTIQWTVTKAWQHTLEHTHDVLLGSGFSSPVIHTGDEKPAAHRWNTT